MYSLPEIRDHESELLPYVRSRRDHPALAYAERVWERHGRWNRYYRAFGAKVLHTSYMCRTINARTILESLPELAGESVTVVSATHRLCRRCPH